MQQVGVKIAVDGAAQFKADIGEIRAKAGELASELDKVVSGLDKNASAADKARAKLEPLTKAVENQQNYVNKLQEQLQRHTTELDKNRAALDEAKKKYGEASPEVAKLSQQIQKQETEISKDQTAINKAEKALAQMEGQLKEAQDAIKNEKWEVFGKSMEKVSNTASKVQEKTKGLSTAAAGLGAALLGNAYKAAQSADELSTLSKQYGVSTDTLQKFNYAQDLVDVSTSAMLGSMKKLTSNMASGSKDVQEAFASLGVSVTDVNGNMRNSEDVWWEVIDRLQYIGNETEKDQLAMKLFGKGAMELAGIIDDGGASLKAYGDEAARNNLILSEESVEAANQFNDSLTRIKGTMTAGLMQAGASLAETLTPAIEKVVEGVQKLATWFTNLSGPAQKTILIVAGIVATISPVAGIVSKVTGALSGLQKTMSVVTKAAGLFSNPWVLIGAAVVAVAVLIIKHWDEIKAFLIEAWNKISATAKQVWDGIKSFFSNTWNGIKTTTTNVWNSITEFFSKTWNGIKNTASSLWNGIKQAVTNPVETAKGLLTGYVNAIEKIFQFVGLGDKVKGIFDGIRRFIEDPIQSAKDAVSRIVDGIKSLFSGWSFSWPSVKMPHFKIKPSGWQIGDLLKGSIPKLSIDWYAKAEKYGAAFTTPQLIGVGDARGPEYLLGDAALKKLGEAMGGGKRDMVVNMNIYTQPGQDAEEIADVVLDRLQQFVDSKEAVFA